MIYPKKIKAKKSEKIIKILFITSIFIAIMLLTINNLTTPKIPWATLSIAGIIYIWVTVIYAINKNTNIAGHVLLQTIALSLLIVFIDYKLGFTKWSINIAVPIIIIVANITMLILTIVSYKKYMKYAIYQLIILMFSTLPVIFITEKIVQNKILSIIAIIISSINLILTLALSTKELKETIIRKFHM